MPPEVVNRVRRLVHMGRDEPHRQDQGHDGQRQREEEDRPPPEVLEQQAGEQRTEGGDRTPRADQSAIDLVRAGPDHSAVISARVVGYAMPAASPPRSRATNRTPSVGAYAASKLAGIANAVPTISMSLRPCRSPSAPRYSTDAARPSE